MAESSGSLAELDPSIVSRIEAGCTGQRLAFGRAGKNYYFAYNFAVFSWEDLMFEAKLLVLDYSLRRELSILEVSTAG